jgi:hypothetical protein
MPPPLRELPKLRRGTLACLTTFLAAQPAGEVVHAVVGTCGSEPALTHQASEVAALLLLPSSAHLRFVKWAAAEHQRPYGPGERSPVELYRQSDWSNCSRDHRGGREQVITTAAIRGTVLPLRAGAFTPTTD